MERKKSPNYNKHLEARCIGCRNVFLKSEMVSISGRKTARGNGIAAWMPLPKLWKDET